MHPTGRCVCVSGGRGMLCGQSSLGQRVRGPALVPASAQLSPRSRHLSTAAAPPSPPPPQIIPAENLVALYQANPAAQLLAAAPDCASGRIMLEALEAGTDGVLLQTDSPAEVGRAFAAAAAAALGRLCGCLPSAAQPCRLSARPVCCPALQVRALASYVQERRRQGVGRLQYEAATGELQSAGQGRGSSSVGRPPANRQPHLAVLQPSFVLQ